MISIKKYIPGILLLFVFICFSITIYQDYGLTIDENSQRDIGLHYYNYVFKCYTSLNSFDDRDHGAGFELPLVILEKQLNITSTRDIYLMRHLATNLFFLLCMFSGYVLALHLFKNQIVACFTFIMLVLEPRIFCSFVL